MNKELFTKQLKERLEEITECKVKVNSVDKNNGVKLTALSIMQEGLNVAPVIYVEPYYELYDSGETFESIIEKIMEYEEDYIIEQNFDLDSFLDFSKVKEKLRYKIVNTEKNIEILKHIPHKDFLDLSKVYYVEVYNTEIGTGTILVSNEHMKQWGVDWEELDRMATEQTEKNNLPCVINMKNFSIGILEKLGIEISVESMWVLLMLPITMVVFTNQRKHLGANVILYKDVLKDYATETNEDLYILPSSTHEVIVIPDSLAQYQGIKGLKEMVKHVNEIQVEPEEFLSDNVYFYDRQMDNIKIV